MAQVVKKSENQKLCLWNIENDGDELIKLVYFTISLVL